MKKIILSALFTIFATTAANANTIISLTSEQGDYVGLGEAYEYTDNNANISYSKNFDEGISINIKNLSPSPWLSWTINFAAPDNAQLEVGKYDGATRFPFQDSTNPGLSVNGNGRGCNKSKGSFEIFEIEYDINGKLSKLDAEFEQFCDNSLQPLKGKISFNTVSLGGTIKGIKPSLAYCYNYTTKQRVYRRSDKKDIDCKKLGLKVNSGDRILFYVVGHAD